MKEFMTKKEPVTKEQIMKAIKECAAKLGRAPSISELVKMTGMHRACLYRKFAAIGTRWERAGWKKAVRDMRRTCGHCSSTGAQ